MIREAACGALSGLIATAPMTVAMELGRRRLPWFERYSLPPRQITRNLTQKAGVRKHVGRDGETWLTAIAHFGYGAAVGAIYGVAARHARAAGPATGVLWGILVWVGSYLGLLPSLRILPPATKHSRRRNALMIIAHLVWGSVTGLLMSRFQRWCEGSNEQPRATRAKRSPRRRRVRV